MNVYKWLVRGRGTPMSFQKSLLAACHANGWQPVFQTHDSVMLVVPSERGVYEVAVFESEQRVAVACCSHGEFLPGRFPPRLREILKQRDQELHSIAWGVVDNGPRKSRGIAVQKFAIGTLNASTLKQAVEEVVAEASLLDDGLRRSGII